MRRDERRALERAVDAERGAARRPGWSALEHAVDQPEQTDDLGPRRRDDVFDVAAPGRDLDDADKPVEPGARVPSARDLPRRARIPTSAAMSATTRSTKKLLMSSLPAMRSDWYGR